MSSPIFLVVGWLLQFVAGSVRGSLLIVVTDNPLQGGTSDIEIVNLTAHLEMYRDRLSCGPELVDGQPN